MDGLVNTTIPDLLTRSFMNPDTTADGTDSVTTEMTNGQLEDDRYIDSASRLSFYQVTVGCIGALSNTFVLIVVFLYTKIGDTLTGRLIINQTVTDVVTSVIVVTFYGMVLGRGTAVPHGGIRAEMFCRIWLTESLLWGSVYASTINLVAIAIERYLAVVHPVWHKLHCNKKHFKVIAIVAWLSGMGYNLTWAALVSHMHEGECYLFDFGGDQQLAQTNGILGVVLFYFVPLACFIGFYGRMVFVIRFKKSGMQANANVKASKSLIRTLLFVTAAFVLCWTWVQINWLFIVLGYNSTYAYDMSFNSNFVAYISLFINPVIYVAQYREFKKGLRIMFNQFRVHPVADSSTASNPSKGNPGTDRTGS